VHEKSSSDHVTDNVRDNVKVNEQLPCVDHNHVPENETVKQTETMSETVPVAHTSVTPIKVKTTRSGRSVKTPSRYRDA
jgi:hypothetical protein